MVVMVAILNVNSWVEDLVRHILRYSFATSIRKENLGYSIVSMDN